jgi:hypothetical protein
MAFTGLRLSIAMGAKEADDEASRLLLSAGLVSPAESACLDGLFNTRLY